MCIKAEIKNNKITIDELCINAIRVLTMDAVQHANSGHPGAPMGFATVGYVLWTRILKHNPKNPNWQDRDRLIFSNGHASMLLYSLLYLSGYNLKLNDIKSFRQFNSKTPGHPEYSVSPGVEVTTGPLGQGVANAVGIAIAESHMAAKFNKPKYKLIDHYTYVICGDGDMMEGVSGEAASMAGHLGLAKLICLYDSNNITIEGKTDITFTENVANRFKSYNWHVLVVEDGNNIDAIEKSILDAKKEKEKPSLIIFNTHIAYGSPNFQDDSNSHGAPLGEEEIRRVKKIFNWPSDEPFFVPKKVISYCQKLCDKGIKHEESWIKLYTKYSKEFPKLSNEWLNSISRFLSNNWDSSIPIFDISKSWVATRSASGIILNAIASEVSSLVGGSSDLAPSNKTYINSSGDFKKNDYIGRNIRFGVREFAMAAIMSGMFIHGGIRPYGGTFLVFSDYMRSAIRMASIMKLPVIYIFTHDSIAVGEDGPTHQPVEHLAALRTIPGLIVIRPADATETVEAWKVAILSNNKPIAIILSRQKLPILDLKKVKYGVKRGAYIISNCVEEPNILIIATGSEVHIGLRVKNELSKMYNISARLISMPSWELFEEQSDVYKNQVIPKNITNRVIIEAGISMGWERYMSSTSLFFGVNNYGFSAPGPVVMEKFGITVENIVNKVKNHFNIF